MTTTFQDLLESFDFVGSAPMFDHEAFLNKESGQIYWQADLLDDFDELPADIDDEKYISIPHKNELGLGKNLALALAFVYQHLPHEADEVEAFFRRKGAYSRFKAFLARKGALEQWYEFEWQAQEKALRQWCEENKIQVHN